MSWSGTYLGIQRFGELEASARVVRNRQEREAEYRERAQAQVAAIYPDLVSGSAPINLAQRDPITWEEGCRDKECYELMSLIAEPKEGESFDDVYDRLWEYTENALILGVSNETRKMYGDTSSSFKPEVGNQGAHESPGDATP